MATKIKYHGATIASLDPGQKATLKCAEELMTTDLEVENEREGEANINGVLEYYRVNAGAKVSAGNFVEFVTKFQNTIFWEKAVVVRGACKLDDSRVLVAYSSHAVVITIKNNGIQIGEAVGTSVFEGNPPDNIVALTGSKALITRWEGQKLSAAILTIDEERITVGPAAEVYTTAYPLYKSAITALSASKVLIAITYTREIGAYPQTHYGGEVRVLGIDGDTITAGGNTTLYPSDLNLRTEMAAVKLAEDRALILTVLSRRTLCGYLITVNQLIPTKNADVTQVGMVENGYIRTAVALSENTAVVFCQESGHMQAYSISIRDTTVTFDRNGVVQEGTCSAVSAATLSENKALIVYSRDNYGRAQVLTMDDLQNFSLSGEYTFDHYTVTSTALVPLSESSALVAYNNATGAIANLTVDAEGNITADSAETGTFVQPATSRRYNVGVARNSGEEGELVAVYCVE